jgi:hypothetical protein
VFTTVEAGQSVFIPLSSYHFPGLANATMEALETRIRAG